MNSDIEPPRENLGEMIIFLRTAHEIEQANLEHFGQLVALVERLGAAFRLVTSNPRTEILPALLLMNAYASYLSASRSALTGQVPPTFMVLRGCLESGLYALLAMDETNAEAWLGRDQDRRRCQQLFTVVNGTRRLRELGDENLANSFHDHHQVLIDLGAHPNRRSLMDQLHIGGQIEAGIPVTLGILHGPESSQATQTLIACIEVAITVLCIARHVLPGATADEAFAEACAVNELKDRYIGEQGFAMPP